MIQIWVNLPKKDKIISPKYQPLTGKEIREALLPGQAGKIRVISGSYEETQGPASTFTPVHMLDVRLKPNAQVRLSAPQDFNAALLVLEGLIKTNGSREIAADEFILFKNDGDEIFAESLSPSTLLFLSGAPIDESLVHYGPFVMNSVVEINQAIEDFNNGKFGFLAD
jgi:hypothetical protein